MKLGLSGRLTQGTIRSPLTPLFLMAALAVGLLALLTIPREEEPQISVPMVDISVNVDGLKAPDAVELVTKPLESIVKGINGVKHVYSQTVDDRVMVTARFKVGTNADDAILRVHEKIKANMNRIPVGIPEPLIVGRGINDVAVAVLTLSPKPDAASRYTEKDLYQIARELQFELDKTENIGLTYISGGNPQQIRVEPDPEKLTLYGVTLQQLVAKVREANRSFLAGQVRDNNTMRDVVAGQTLTGMPDIGLLLVTTRDGRPVYVRDVAKVVIGPSPMEHRVWFGKPEQKGQWERVPAVSIAFAKKSGTNAVVVAEDLLARLKTVEGRLVPKDVTVTVTRDYGQTANEKANELLFHLGLATVSIVILIALAIGWREALVTLVVIPTTILLTLFASKMMGYTINRVSLFALIFSIGILVDDAIVVVENIARHWAMKDGRSPHAGGDRGRRGSRQSDRRRHPHGGGRAAADAVRVRHDGPLHGADPGQRLGGHAVLVLRRHGGRALADAQAAPGRDAGARARGAHGEGFLGKLYRRFATPILKTRKRAWIFLISVGLATVAVCVLFYTENVTVKLLPFDNKSELSVVVDLPDGATLEDTERTLFALADVTRKVPEVRSIETYAGTPAPFNFNGLVRHYYLRNSPELGELHVNLAPKADRDRSSHEIALDLRTRLKKLTLPNKTVVRVVEVPPGPPVMATLLAEVYGPVPRTGAPWRTRSRRSSSRCPISSTSTIPSASVRRACASPSTRTAWNSSACGSRTSTTPSSRCSAAPPSATRIAARAAIRSRSSSGCPRATCRGATCSPRRRCRPTPCPAARAWSSSVTWCTSSRRRARRHIFRRDGHFTDMVMAEMAGAYEAPIYGMLAVDKLIDQHNWGKLGKPTISFHGQPAGRSQADAAVGRRVGDHLRHLPRHGRRLRRGDPRHLHPGGGAVRQLQIAAGHPDPDAADADRHHDRPLAVRRAVHGDLDDRLHRARRHHRAQLDPAGRLHPPWRRARARRCARSLLEAGAVRFKPILLTALAAMIGAATILVDPIFQGLAISLLFGLASSTLLTVLVIPAIYVVLRDADRVATVSTSEPATPEG